MRSTARVCLAVALVVLLAGTPRIASAQAPTGETATMDDVVGLVEMAAFDEARQALVQVAGTLAPVEATAVLRLAEVLSSSEGALRAAVGLAIIFLHEDDPEAAVEALVVAAEEEGHPPHILNLAAHLAEDAGDVDRARALRESVVEEHPRDPLAAESIVWVARDRLNREAEPAPDLEATARLVEDLIVEHPSHPLVPTARRLLQRLRAEEG